MSKTSAKPPTGASSPSAGQAAALLAEGVRRQALGGFEEARQLIERALQLAPDDAGAWAALAGCHLAARSPEAALTVCETGLRRLGPSAALLCAKARVLQNVSRVDEAAACLRQALDVDPASGEARFGLALLALEAGDLDRAEALAPADPASPRGTWLRARIAFGRADLETARRLAAQTAAAPGLAPEPRAEALLLLGQALDGLGRPREAFAAVRDGKAALRGLYAERAAGRESETAKFQRLAAWFRGADPAHWSFAPPDDRAPARGHAFLVGFPRSGTTLLEQALAGHPDLVSLEEAPTLADAYAEFLASDAGLERLARITRAEAEHWRRVYWSEAARHGVDPRGRVFLDKAPAGTLYLPLIAKLFPDARILFALRDPRDVALSCLRNSFQMNALTYAFTDLAETARCYGACMAMAAVYRAVLPLDLLEVRHEQLVAAFAPELGRIAAFLGLDPAPLVTTDVAATARRRVVRTPSAPQVRAGLNRQGLGRWRAYADELAPVMETLAPWIEAFGYEVGGASG